MDALLATRRCTEQLLPNSTAYAIIMPSTRLGIPTTPNLLSTTDARLYRACSLCPSPLPSPTLPLSPAPTLHPTGHPTPPSQRASSLSTAGPRTVRSIRSVCKHRAVVHDIRQRSCSALSAGRSHISVAQSDTKRPGLTSGLSVTPYALHRGTLESQSTHFASTLAIELGSWMRAEDRGRGKGLGRAWPARNGSCVDGGRFAPGDERLVRSRSGRHWWHNLLPDTAHLHENIWASNFSHLRSAIHIPPQARALADRNERTYRSYRRIRAFRLRSANTLI